MSVYKRGKQSTHWHYYFRVRGVRYRGAIPEATTKWDAEQAESKIKREVFENRFGQVDLGSEKLAEFIEKAFFPGPKQTSGRGDMTSFEHVQSATISKARSFARFRLCWLKNSNVTDANRSRRGGRFVALPQSILSLRY